MSIVTQSTSFLASLLAPSRRPVCPHCGSLVWKHAGYYHRGKRCLDGLEAEVSIPRYRCKDCGRTWSERPAWLSPGKWYGRDVIRMSLDLCLDGTTSWRQLSSLVHGVLTGAGRGLRWAPWHRPRPGAERIRLSHTTLWRWFQEAAEKAQKEQATRARYEGLSSGVLATDESWGYLKGWLEGVCRKVGFGVQVLVDGQNRVVFSLGRLVGESEEALRAGLEDLGQRGVNLAQMRAWLSDGLSTYLAVLEMLGLSLVPRQRSIFHLWRNLAGEIKAYGVANGQEAADELRAAIRAVWDAGSEGAAVVGLMKLIGMYGKDPLASKTVWLVHTTFKEATLYLKGVVPDLARTNGVAEWVWRFYKRRMRLVQCFMSEAGCDNFLALYELYLNFHRYQVRKERKRHYPYPGHCPLEIGGASIEADIDGRRVVASWMDALAI